MRASLLIAALLLTAAAPADKKPKGMVITPASAEGAIILRAPRMPIEYVIGISAYDPVERQLKSGTFSGGWADVEVKRMKEGRNASDYFVRKVKPGSYVFRAISQQSAWANCYHAKTFQFEVKPGEVLYLGAFDGATALMQLQENIVRSGRLSVQSGNVAHYFDDIPAPPLERADDAALAAAQAKLRADMPTITSPLRAAAIKPATFGTGRDLFGLQRICGGWHKKKGKPIAEPGNPAE
jgi:hypothetical protein